MNCYHWNGSIYTPWRAFRSLGAHVMNDMDQRESSILVHWEMKHCLRNAIIPWLEVRPNVYYSRFDRANGCFLAPACHVRRQYVFTRTLTQHTKNLSPGYYYPPGPPHARRRKIRLLFVYQFFSVSSCCLEQLKKMISLEEDDSLWLVSYYLNCYLIAHRHSNNPTRTPSYPLSPSMYYYLDMMILLLWNRCIRTECVSVVMATLFHSLFHALFISLFILHFSMSFSPPWWSMVPHMVHMPHMMHEHKTVGSLKMKICVGFHQMKKKNNSDSTKLFEFFIEWKIGGATKTLTRIRPKPVVLSLYHSHC